MSAALTCLAFWLLVGLTVHDPERRRRMLARSAREWWLDLTGLTVQGVLVPIVLVVPLVSCCHMLWPEARGALEMPWWLSFCLAFLGVDYVYYWNHRLLHSARLWPLHMVHHSAEQMDVLVTSRNTLWTSLFVVYLWATSFFSFVLRDPAPYLLGAGLTAVLDLARHSPLSLAHWPRLERMLGLVFVLPQHHARHHADLPVHGNYGANFIWWDKLHGTFCDACALPDPLGVESPLGLARSLFWPWYVSGHGRSGSEP